MGDPRRILVVGLGNPGPEYAETRHNIGFLAVDALAATTAAAVPREKFSGEFSVARVGEVELLLLKPLTFMNRSGDSVQPAAAFYKVPPSDVLVIHDEMDLAAGEVRLKRGGGIAGHNGLRSIQARLGTQDFCRIRIGIGRPPGVGTEHVLGRFRPDEREAMKTALQQATEGVLTAASQGFDHAMAVRNAKPDRNQRTSLQGTAPGANNREEKPS